MKNNGIASYRNVIAALAVPLLVGACASVTVGRPFDYEAFASQVRVGSSDLAQVQAALGPPIGKGLVAEADGSLYDQWTYYYGRGDMANAEKNRFKRPTTFSGFSFSEIDVNPRMSANKTVIF